MRALAAAGQAALAVNPATAAAIAEALLAAEAGAAGRSTCPNDVYVAGMCVHQVTKACDDVYLKSHNVLSYCMPAAAAAAAH